MSHDSWPNGSYADFADLARRRDALRQSAEMPGADPSTLLDAAFAELDAAVDAAAKLAAATTEESATEESAADAASRGTEAGLLRAVFAEAPVPLFLLDPDGTILRANGRAGDLISAPPGYATGRPLTAFIDLPSRAAVNSQLAAAARTGTARQSECKLLGPAGTGGTADSRDAAAPAEVTMAANVIDLPDATRLLIVTMTEPTAARAGHPAVTVAAGDPGTSRAIQSLTRRMDMITAVTRLLLDNSTFSEAVTLQRCARLLAGDIASWVIIDVERADRLQRQFVVGPHDEAAEELARKARAVDPPPGSMPARVHAAGRSVVLAHAEDAEILGVTAEGTPLLMLLGATSLLSVPISDGATSYGVLTLARQASEGRFEIAELGLAEELGEHLGVAIRVDRMFRHRSAVAEALQGSLLPARLPDVPGLDLSAAYLPAGEGLEASGDFYDVFQVQDGWAITVGDVCGKGQEAAAMTAAARHAIRAIAHGSRDPVEVLAKVNEIILAGDYEDRFVTAKLAYLSWDGDRVHVVLATSGHPGPAVVRPDGRVDVLSGVSLPLGLFPDAQPDREEFDLHPDDLLFFYSDGVTEARSADMRYFEERLSDELAGLAGRSAAETARMVQGLVTRFSEDRLRDDMTIVVAKVKPAGELLTAVGGHHFTCHLGDLDVPALGFLAQALQRVVSAAVERVHQDALGLIDHRSRDHGVLELAGGPLSLVVGGGVGEHGTAERGEHVRHGVGLGVQHARTHAEQRQHQDTTRELTHQVDRAADPASQGRLGVVGPASVVKGIRATHRHTGIRCLDQRAAADPELQVSQLGQVRMGRRRADHLAVTPDRRVRARTGLHLPGGKLGELVQRPGLSAVGQAQ
jgi:serine phosphatase RsbU (regulator of sigma subunit)/PAS domain-containing protein